MNMRWCLPLISSIAVVLVATEGVLPWFKRRWGKPAPARATSTVSPPSAVDTIKPVHTRTARQIGPVVMKVEHLSRHYGGLQAVADVSFEVHEGAILGNLGTKTQQEFSRILSAIPYRWVATATPAPNDYRQLIYFADFLDAMDAGQSLTRWFGRNPDKAGDLQLMPHMEKDFWLWVASWCLFVDKPSDLGGDNTGYIMPELDIRSQTWVCCLR